jgi:hypothetical protein
MNKSTTIFVPGRLGYKHPSLDLYDFGKALFKGFETELKDKTCFVCDKVPTSIETASTMLSDEGPFRLITLPLCSEQSKRCLDLVSRALETVDLLSDLSTESVCAFLKSEIPWICTFCHAVRPKKQLSRCGQCRRVFYCGVSCQNLDWKRGHKRICAVPSE